MPNLSLGAWALVVGVAAMAIISSLFALARRMEREKSVHDLAVESHRLRREYMRWIEALRRGDGDKVARPSMKAAAAARKAA